MEVCIYTIKYCYEVVPEMSEFISLNCWLCDYFGGNNWYLISMVVMEFLNAVDDLLH